jgi:hypothetical protein
MPTENRSAANNTLVATSASTRQIALRSAAIPVRSEVRPGKEAEAREMS